MIAWLRIQYINTNGIDLSTEEAQYWLWSKNMDWSYYSKPPLIAWVNYLSGTILPHGELSVKINSILIGFVTPYPLYFLTKNIFHQNKIAVTAALLLLTFPFFNYITIYFTTDSLVFVFWMFTLLYTWKAIESGRIRHWFLASLFMGLGLLSKYTMILFYPALVLFILFEKQFVRHFKGLVVFIAVSLLFLLPVLIWNFAHDFVSFKHVFHLSGATQSYSVSEMLSNVGEYLGGQLLVLSPFYIFLIIFSVHFFKKERKQKLSLMGTRYLIIPVVFIWVVFSLVAVKNIEANWLIFSYGVTPILLANYFLLNFPIKWKSIVISATVLLQILILNPSILDQWGLRKLYPPEFDTLHRFAGWKNLGEKVSEFREKQVGDKSFIFSDNYHIASELAFYVDGQPQTYCINLGRRMNQFDIWEGINQYSNKNFDAIYVSYNPAPPKLIEAFEAYEKYEFTRRYRELYKKEMFIYVMEDFKGLKQQKSDSY
jgi:4-amino-4-deoxy-L-arabinose transferase-like glycosyltransferase